MTWQTEDGQHEGWAAATFVDGGLGSGWGCPDPQRLGRDLVAEDYGVLVARVDGPDGQRELAYEQWQYRPVVQVTGWVAACTCGWRGRPWIRVSEPAGQDLAARRVYPGDDVDAARLPELEAAVHDEWLSHVRPHEVLAQVAALASEHAEVGRRLDAAAVAARVARVSWADIGAAAGITRQSAHERWRHLAAAGTRRCPAAHAEDASDCEGPPDAVRVLDAAGDEVTGCVHHGAVLLASLDGARVSPGPGGAQGAATETFRRAQALRPFTFHQEG